MRLFVLASKLYVEASVAIAGTFDKWVTDLRLTSAELMSGVLDIRIQADSVNAGSGNNTRDPRRLSLR